jgi:hypothetical protein
MPELNLGAVKLTNDSLTGRIFRSCIDPQRSKHRQKVTIYIETELMQQYEKHHPRRNDGSFGGQLSDDCNKGLVVWLQVHGLIDPK